MKDALRGAPARVLALLLVSQAAVYYAVASRKEAVPPAAPLSGFARTLGGWTAERDYDIEKEVQDVLRADDLLSRVYVSDTWTDGVSLFIAYFKTQRFGQAPHSPKNCLPGSGWLPTEDSKLPIAIPGRAAPIVVNKYVISRGDQQSLVLYWYQSHSRVIAGELSAKFWLVADAIRYNRSDTALVRVIAPVRESVDRAEKKATEFVQAVFPVVDRQFSN